MKKDGDPVDGDMVNKELDDVAAEGEGSSVAGRGKAVRKGGVQCKLPLSRISGFMGAPRVMCLFCDRSFLSAVLLQKHTNRCHRVTPARRTSARNTEQQTITTHNYHPGCNFCNSKALAVQKADDLPGLFHHLLDKHSLKYFGCRLCQQRFSDSNQLKSHNQIIHPELLESSISNNSENNTKDVNKYSSNQLPASETNNETVCSSNSLQNSYESFETDLCNLNAKVLTKRVTLSTPSSDSNRKELRSRKSLSKTRNAKTLNKEISVMPPDSDIKNNSSNEVKQDPVILIPPPPRDGFKPLRSKDGLPESIDKKLSKMSRASVTLTPVQIKPNSNNDPQVLSRLGLAQNRSPRTQSVRRNRKAPPTESRSASEVSRRDKSKGKNDSEFIINKNRIDPSTKFDPDFYSTVSDNVRENLLKHLDGKLEKSNVACDVPDFIDPKIRSTHAILERPFPKQPAEIHGSDVALNAITIFPTLLAQDQYGSDKVPHYSYGANSQGFKKTITKNSWKWKWDVTKKIKQIPDVGKRDLSRLDIWTQLTMRERYDKDISKIEDSEVDPERAVRQRQVNELNAIMSRRILPDIESELKMSVRKDDETVVDIVEEMIIDKTDYKKEESSSDKLLFMSSLELTVRNDMSSKSEDNVFSGEWQRPRCYVCCVCGRRAECLRLMEVHQVSQHPYAQATYYELVGKEAIENQLHKHLYIPGLRKHMLNITKKIPNKKSHKILRPNQSTRILRTTAKNIKMQERQCTKCNKSLSPSELHKHILECAGDYGWMMSKKKCKSKPFGARRRRLKGLYKRERPQEDGERTEKDSTPRPKLPPRPRSKPSDVETIQKMLANLPAKRTSKQVLDISSPKVKRKVLNKGQSRILRRILPDSNIQRSSKVVRTIKNGKLRRVTRSIKVPETTEKKTRNIDSPLPSRKIKVSNKISDKSDQSVSEESPMRPPTMEIKIRTRKSSPKGLNTSSPSLEKRSLFKEKKSDSSPKNDASSAANEESKEDSEHSEKERRFLRRRPDNSSNAKIIINKMKKINHLVNKTKQSDCSNLENTQDNSNPITPSLAEDKIENKKTKSSLSTVKRKSKKILGLPLKWIGKRGRVSRMKKKIVENSIPVIDKADANKPADTTNINISNAEPESNNTVSPISVPVISTLDKQNAISESSNKELVTSILDDRVNENKHINSPPPIDCSTLNSSVENNLPVTTLANDPRHTNTNLGFTNYGNQSHNVNSQGQNPYHSLYNSTVQDGTISNLGGKTAGLNYNHTLGYYLPSSLQIVSHSKHDKNYERTANMHKADDFALDNIDKPPLFSSVRAQTQMKEIIHHEIPPSYISPSLTVGKAYMHNETNYDIAHANMSKSKMSSSKTSKRGLNDCIAMLRGKLTASKSTNEIESPIPSASGMSMSDESSHYEDYLQPLDLSGRCQAEDLSVNRNVDVPENLTVPKPHNIIDDYQEVQDLSMKSSTPKTKPSLLSVRKPVFDPTLRIPQFSPSSVEQTIPKPTTSALGQSNYIAHSSSSSTITAPFSPKVAAPSQPAIDLPSNISHELSLLPQALVNTIEKLPPFQQEEIVKVLPQVLVKAVENYNLLRTESSKRQNEQDIMKNISSLTPPIELRPTESPARREEHVRPRPTVMPQTSEISTQTSIVATKEEDIQKCQAEYLTANTDVYAVPVSLAERKIDKLPNKIVDQANILPIKSRPPHEVIDLTDEVTVKEPEEIIPAAIIEKPKDSDSQVRSVVIDPTTIDKPKVLEPSKPVKGTASLRAVRIKSTSEKMKIKNLALSESVDKLPSIIPKPISFIPQDISEPISKPIESKCIEDKEEVTHLQQSTENTITSSKDLKAKNESAEPLETSNLELVEPAIQQDEVSSTQHSSVEDSSDVSTDISLRQSMSPLRKKLKDIQATSRKALANIKLNDSSQSEPVLPEKSTDNVPVQLVVQDKVIPEVTVEKPLKEKANTRRKRAVKGTKEKKVIETTEMKKLKENTKAKDIKEVNPVVDKRDKGEPKTADSESDKKASFNNLLKECNTLSESALTPSNVIDFHTEQKALDKCESVQMSEPIQDDTDSDRNISVRRSLRSKKTIIKEIQATIEKDTNIFESRDHNNVVERIPDVPGAIIPEESYKANLGSRKDTVVEEIIKLPAKESISKDESDDDDDICLAAFSKKSLVAAGKSSEKLVVNDTTITDVPSLIVEDIITIPSIDLKDTKNTTEKLKVQRKSKKKSSRLKKAQKAILVDNEKEVDKQSKQVVEDVILNPPEIIDVQQKLIEEKIDEITSSKPSIESIHEDKKVVTRESKKGFSKSNILTRESKKIITRESRKDLSYEQKNDSIQETIKDITREEKEDSTQETAKKSTSEQNEDFTQETTKKLTLEQEKNSTQETIKNLINDHNKVSSLETKNLTSENKSALTQTIKGSTRGSKRSKKNSSIEPTKDMLCESEKDSTLENKRESILKSKNESNQRHKKNLMQKVIKEAIHEITDDLTRESIKNVICESNKDSICENKLLPPDESKTEITQDIKQDDGNKNIVSEGKNDSHHENKEPIVEGKKDPTHENKKESIHESKKNSTHEYKNDSIHENKKDSVHDSKKDSVYESKKDSTRKSGRIKSLKETFASIDSVKLSENGHLIFKMHKEPKETVDKVTTGESEIKNTVVNVELPKVLEEPTKSSTKSKKLRRSKIETPKEVNPVEPIKPQEVDLPNIVKETIPVEAVVDNDLSKVDKKSQSSKKKSQKRAKKNIIVVPLECKDINEDESDKPLIAFKKDVDKQLEPVLIKTVEKKNDKKSKASKVLTLPILTPQTVEPSIPVTVPDPSQDMVVNDIESTPEKVSEKDLSSDEDIALCKLVPKKKLKILRSRSSPRNISVKDISIANEVLPQTPAKDSSKDTSESNIDSEIIPTPEVRKQSIRIKNISKRNDFASVITDINETTPTKDDQQIENVQSVVEISVEPDKPNSIIEKRSSRKLSTAQKEKEVVNIEPEVVNKKTKKPTQSKLINKIAQSEDLPVETNLESSEKSLINTNEVIPDALESEITLKTSLRKSRKYMLDEDLEAEKVEKVETSSSINRIKTKAARKDESEIIVPSLRLTSPRRSAMKIAIETEIINNTETITTTSNSNAEITSAPVPTILTSVRRSSKKSSSDVEILNQVKEKSNKTVKKSKSQLDENDSTPVSEHVQDVAHSLRRTTKTLTTDVSDTESAINENKSKALHKNDSIGFSKEKTPEVVLSPQRNAKIAAQLKLSPLKIVDKQNTESSSKEDDIKEPEVPVPGSPLSLRRSTKRSPSLSDITTLKADGKNNVEIKSKGLLKEDVAEKPEDDTSNNLHTPEIPKDDTSNNLHTPKKSKKKSILERELLIQPKECEEMLNDVSLITERSSPRKHKKKLSEPGSLPIEDVEKIKSKSVICEPSNLEQHLPVVTSPTKSKKPVILSEPEDVVLDKSEEEPLLRSARKSRYTAKPVVDDLPSNVIDELDGKIIRRKSSRTIAKEAIVIDKDVTLETPKSQEETIKIADVPIVETNKSFVENVLSVSTPEDIKITKVRVSRSSLRSKPEDNVVSPPKNDTTPTKDSMSVENSDEVPLVPPVKLSIETITSPNKTPTKKTKKNIKMTISKASNEHTTKKCHVSLDELDVTKMKNDLRDGAVIYNVSNIETTPVLLEMPKLGEKVRKTKDQQLPSSAPHVEDAKPDEEKPTTIEKEATSKSTVESDKVFDNIPLQTIANPDIIESSNDVNIPVAMSEKVIKKKSSVDFPRKNSSKKQIVHVDVHVPREDVKPDNYEVDISPASMPKFATKVESSKKSKKHKKKSSSKAKVTDFNEIYDDLSLEEPLQSIVEAGKSLDDSLAKYSEEETSDKTDSSTCLASLVSGQRKTKKKKNKSDKSALDHPSKKSKATINSIDNKFEDLGDDSLSDSENLLKLKTIKNKSGLKRKRKLNELASKEKDILDSKPDETVSQEIEMPIKNVDSTTNLQKESDIVKENINALPTDPESIQDKYLADFGMYTEKRPRKSTLLAMKKISKTFKPEDESDDNKSDEEEKPKKIVIKKNKKATEPKSCQEVEKSTVEKTKSIPVSSPPPQVRSPTPVEISKEDIIEMETPKLDTQPDIIESQDSQASSNVEEINRVDTPATEDEIDVSKKKGSEYFCTLCKRKFRRHDNLLKHQMTLMHISRVSEEEAKQRENKIVQEEKPSSVEECIAQEKQKQKASPQRTASRVHKNVAERKSFDNKTTDPAPDTTDNNEQEVVSKDSSKSVLEIPPDSSRKTLSTDEALFFECCSLLKESNDIPIGATVEPGAGDSYPLANEQNNSSSDSTPYISGVKNILKASQLVPPSLTGESDNTMELSQTDSNSEAQVPQEERAFAFANKINANATNEERSNRFEHFLGNEDIFGLSKKVETTPTDSNDMLKKHSGDYDPYSAESLMVRTNSDDFSDNGDSVISSQDNETVQNAKNQQSASDKSVCPPILINEFEDKFDKIKRKAREKAQAAQEAMAAVIAPPRSHSKKSGKKSSKSKKTSSDKKSSQHSLNKLAHKSKNKSKKKNIAPSASSEKVNSKKILTKGALKGFDSVKVSISSEEINFQDVLDTKQSPLEYKLDKSKDLKVNDYEINDNKMDSTTSKSYDMTKKTLPLFGKSSLKDKQKPLLNFDNKIDSPIINDKHDIYEFMDDDDDNMSDSFKFRTPTAINRGNSSKKGELPLGGTTTCNKSSIDAQNDDSQISSLSFSDRDDFTYMSDDYNAHESEEETNHSSNSLEVSAIVSKSSKKHRKSSKHRNIKKNAIMGKIFKNNAIRNNDQSPTGNEGIDNPNGPLEAHTDMDQLFDSLFEKAIPESGSQTAETDNKASADASDTDDVYSATDEMRTDDKTEETNVRSPSVCDSDSDNDDDPNPIPAYPRAGQRKIVPRLKARSSDDETLQPKPQQPQLSKKIDIGVASHKSQRKCTTGKQNVLVESWSSESDYEDFRQFEEYSSIPKQQKHHRRPRRSGRHRQQDQNKLEQTETIESNDKVVEKSLDIDDENKISNYNDNNRSDENITEPQSPNKPQDHNSPNVSSRRVQFTPNMVFSKNKSSSSSKRKRRQSQKPFDYDDEFKPARIAEPLTTQRRNKRTASEMLYYWSSSSDDDVKNASNDISGREPEPVEQHGWIVGDSHKKLVTMLAHAKGRKIDDNASVKEKKSRPSS